MPMGTRTMAVPVHPCCFLMSSSAVSRSGRTTVTSYLQQEFPGASITVVESKSLKAHLFRADMENGSNAYDVLVFNEVLRIVTDAAIPKRLRVWNVAHW